MKDSILVFILLLGLGILGYLIINKQKQEVPISDFSIDLGDESTWNSNMKKEEVTSVQNSVDCKEDINCFIASLENNCQIAKVTHVLSISDPFSSAMIYPDIIKSTTKTYYEIRSGNDSQCTVYEKFISGSASYNPEALSKLISEDPTFADEKEELINSFNSGFSMSINKDAVCNIAPQEFKTKIEDKIKGNVSINATYDSSGIKNETEYSKKCEGSLYN
jgi:hypothetical protein